MVTRRRCQKGRRDFMGPLLESIVLAGNHSVLDLPPYSPIAGRFDLTTGRVDLTRFRGHLINWEEGIHDVEKKSPLSG